MARWWPDVSDYDEAERATRQGMWASVAFIAMLALGFALTAFMSDAAPGGPIDPNERALALAGIAVEAAIAMLAAWRFRLGKGWIPGTIVLLLFVIEIAVKLLSGGFLGVFWYVAYFFILAGLANGIRGAFALRGRTPLEPETLTNTFE
jgi:hypothetical protein